MMTPPPATKARESTGSMPAARTSAGQIPVVSAPPSQAGGAEAPAKAAAPARPPVMRLKTQGLPIKTKIVLAMSLLAAGVSLLVFIIVLMIATASLDSTIEQAGVGMLQQAEAIHRPYRAGLNEKGLIAYFGQPDNRQNKFKTYWDSMQETHFHKRIPACGDFANWDQLRDDRLWVLVAGEMIDRPEAFAALTEEKKIELLGPAWNDVKNLAPGGKDKAREPNLPRRVNYEAMEAGMKGYFTALFTRFGRNVERDSFAALRKAVFEKTDTDLINSPMGLRKKIFSELKGDFTADLDELVSTEGSQVKFIIFEMPGGLMVDFGPEELTVISPDPKKSAIERLPSNDTRVVGDVTVDRGALINGAEAYGFSKDISNGERISIYLDRKEIQSRKNTLLFSILGISVVCVVLAIGLAFVLGGGITKPLNTLMSDIQIISGGNFDHRPLARSRDEVGILSRLLGDMAAGLKSAQAVWLENQGRKHDLDIAKEIQENLLPKHVPRIAGYDVSAYYSPSKEVGGDYYDFFLVDKTHLGMVCADVSGKGIPGSMVMMMCKALVSYEAQANLSPRDIFCKVNRTLAKDIKRGMFVTAFYMLLDIPTARLTVASAGHNPLLLYRAATKQCIEVNPGGIALGFDKDGRLFERNMKEEVIQLQRGDRAVIFTDGVTEAMSPTNEEFGEQRMQAITIQCANKSSAEYLTTLVNAIQGHAQADEQHDDITIVTVKVG